MYYVIVNKKSVLAITLFAIFLVFASLVYGFSLDSIEVRQTSDKDVEVTVSTNLLLTDEVDRALRSNIPITITSKIKIYRVRENIWDDLIGQYEISDQIRFESLYQHYRVTSPDVDLSGAFPSVGEALDRIGKNRKYQGISVNEPFDTEETYRCKVKISLDRSSLPSVLKMMAFIGDAWRLSTGWSDSEKWQPQQ